eukprot:scaffold178163_cov42-Prasinocladus_malaysianus.AAC.1
MPTPSSFASVGGSSRELRSAVQPLLGLLLDDALQSTHAENKHSWLVYFIEAKRLRPFLGVVLTRTITNS